MGKQERERENKIKTERESKLDSHVFVSLEGVKGRWGGSWSKCFLFYRIGDNLRTDPTKDIVLIVLISMCELEESDQR